MIANRIIEADHGDLVEVGEQGLHHRVFEAELCISLLAVLRRPRGEHLILENVYYKTTPSLMFRDKGGQYFIFCSS